jgi:hypothetical protein
MKVVGNVKEKNLVKLGDVKPGKVVRFPAIAYEEALTGKDDATFYLVIKVPNEKPGRTTLVSLDGLSVIERDGINLVCVHEAEIAVYNTPH